MFKINPAILPPVFILFATYVEIYTAVAFRLERIMSLIDFVLIFTSE